MFEYLGRSFAVAPLAQGALAALLVVVLGRRFGPPRLIQEEQRRSSMEYVRAMGDLLHRARASGLALESMASWVEEEACRVRLEGDEPSDPALRKAEEQAPRTADVGPGSPGNSTGALWGAGDFPQENPQRRDEDECPMMC